MAAGAFVVFGNAIEQHARGAIDFDTDSFRMVLVTSSWTPSDDADDAWSDISGNEVANGNGYTTHGKALTMSVMRMGSPAPGTVHIDCDDQSWTSSTITAKYAVVVRDDDGNGALAAGDIPICYSDLDEGGGSISTTNGTFAVNINANGLFTLARSA